MNFSLPDRHPVFPRGAAPFAFALACLLLTARESSAEEPVMPEPPRYTMPAENIFPDEVLAREFEYFKSVPFNDPDLAIALPARSSWKWIELRSDTKGHHNRFVTLARIEAPQDPEIAVEMKYLLLHQEVRLEDWVDYFLDTEEMTALDGHVTEYFERHVVDVLAEFKVPDGRAFLARMVFFKNGNRIYLTAGTAPRERYEQVAREFGVSVTAATPQSLSTAECAEPLKTWSMTQPVAFSFSYPGSWTVRARPGGEHEVGAVDLIQGDEEHPRGLIRVRAYPRARFPEFGADQASWSVFSEVQERAARFELVERTDLAVARAEGFPGPGRTARYQVRLDDAPAEARELILVRDDAVIAVLLIAPEPTQGRLNHLANCRAWEWIGSHLKAPR